MKTKRTEPLTRLLERLMREPLGSSKAHELESRIRALEDRIATQQIKD